MLTRDVATLCDVDHPPQRCYLCNGHRVIEVTELDENDDELTYDHVCVRCHGKGYITDGFNLDSIQHPSMAMTDARQVCICNYPVDGPMGNPRCPAR